MLRRREPSAALERAFEREAGDEDARVVHRAPSVRLTIDGVVREPAEINEFDGRVLHFFATGPGGRHEALHAFTTAERAHRFLSEQGPPGRAATLEGRQRELLEEYGALFYSDADFRGDELWWRAGAAQPDLRRERRGWFWLWTWNDTISSLLVDIRRTVTCWEHINYWGSSLTFTGIGEASLSRLGWNDRVSSIQCW